MPSPSRFEIPILEDDGLPTPEVGDWADDKYRLVNLYTRLFTTSMRGKWDRLVYLDLFAGPGRVRVKGTDRVLPGSPTLALSLDPPFDLHILCEQDPTSMGTLQRRVERDFHGRDVQFLQGDANRNVDDVLATLPMGSSQHGVLSFCFVDPYGMQNLQFSTISELAQRRMDFLVLIPTGYDATRNQELYADEESTVVERFLGNPRWRQEWRMARGSGTSFDVFITDAFGASMKGLGYIYKGVADTQPIRLTSKNVLLYRLALFSQHELGGKFWRQVKKYAPDQRSLF